MLTQAAIGQRCPDAAQQRRCPSVPQAFEDELLALPGTDHFQKSRSG
jgi:hypothetical protein